MAALICLLTAVLHIPVPNGYLHCGDAMVYLAAVTLPMPYAVCASAVGGAMADLLSGYPMYIFPTFLIKAAMAFCFAKICEKQAEGTHRREITASVVCCVISVAGYWAAAAVLYGNAAAQALETMPMNLIQGIVSAALYFAVRTALRKK